MEEQKQAEQQWNKIRRERINILKEAPSEENLWQAVMAFQDYGIVSVLASDAHDFEYRTPSMNRLVAYLERRYPKKLIRMWLSENPSRILNGMPILTT